MKRGVSRRDFIKGAAASALSVAAMGVLGGCAQADATTQAATEAVTEAATAAATAAETTAPESPSTEAATVAQTEAPETAGGEKQPWLRADNGMFDWRIKPEEPKEFTETLSADVIVCGGGLSGLNAARRAAELGNSVIVVQKGETYDIHGFQCATFNSSMVKEVVENDPVEFFNAYMETHGHRCNPDIIRLWIDQSGPAFDWYEELMPERGDDYKTNYRSVIYAERPQGYSTADHKYKTFRGTIDFTYESWAYAGERLYEKTLELGVEYRFKESGYMLTQDGSGRVTGLIARVEDDSETPSYVKYEAAKGVIVSTGYHGTAQDIMMEIGVEEAVYTLRNGQPFPASSGFGGTGDGHRMLVWAGGEIEPFRQADGCALSLLDPAAGLSLNKLGKRWHNEDDQCWSLGLEMRWQPGKMAWKIYDKNWRACLPYQNMSHMAIDPYASTPWTVPPKDYKTLADGVSTTDGETNYLDYLDQELMAGVGNPDGITIGRYWSWQGNERYGAETLEELADMMGYDAEAKANMLAEIEEYNKMCEQGRDTRYGKSPSMLFPVKEGPFFAFSTSTSLSGRMGQEGIMTNGRLQPVVAETGKPIEGVYLAGVIVGGRHANCYMTPMGGMNHGFDVTFGKMAAEFLNEDNQ